MAVCIGGGIILLTRYSVPAVQGTYDKAVMRVELLVNRLEGLSQKLWYGTINRLSPQKGNEKMTIVLEMTPELENQIRRAASRAGIPLDKYVLESVVERLAQAQQTQNNQ